MSQSAHSSAPQHWRPLMHYSPANTWLNDPNGLAFDGSRYHLYYQSNPHGSDWGFMSWGHATSPDLYTWTEHATAIRHTDEEQIYSGSIVVDHGNTSGLGTPEEPPLVALYTSAYTDTSPRPRIQAQSLAWSTDGGMTWTRHPGNPVLDRGSRDFRDPKVFRFVPPGAAWSDGWWVMVVVEAAAHEVLVYRSDTLSDWDLVSAFGPHHATDGAWECPDLFPLPVHDESGRATGEQRWVLVASIHPGGPHGGSAMQYFIGDFDGCTFTLDPALEGTPLWLDGGRDYYAAISFDNVADRRLMMGWVGNWDYSLVAPTAPWRGQMSLPRVVDLQHTPGGLRVRQHLLLPDEVPAQVLIERHTVPLAPGVASMVTLTSAAGDPVTLTVDGTTRSLTVDRSACGTVDFSEWFARGGGLDLVTDTDSLDLLIISDGCVLVVVAEGGLSVLTHLVFPAARLDSSVVSTR